MDSASGARDQASHLYSPEFVGFGHRQMASLGFPPSIVKGLDGPGRNLPPGHVPIEAFLYYFLPKGEKLNRRPASKAVRHFHLAFKGMETEEIYDVLMELLVTTIHKYDPDYKTKVKRVVETIDHELSQRRQFTFADVNRYLDLDCHRYLRLLGRVGFLQRIPSWSLWALPIPTGRSAGAKSVDFPLP